MKDTEGLEAVLRSDCRIVFLLYGTVLDLPETVGRPKRDGRTVLLNVDLLEGSAGKEIVGRYVKERTSADGVLGSKAFMVRAARALGLYAVHRFFLIDSLSYRKLAPQVRASQADCVTAAAAVAVCRTRAAGRPPHPWTSSAAPGSVLVPSHHGLVHPQTPQE